MIILSIKFVNLLFFDEISSSEKAEKVKLKR